MKPKTKLQKKVCKLVKELPELSQKQKAWAFNKCVDHLGYSTVNGLVNCLSCGQAFQGIIGRKRQKCQVCNRQLTIQQTRKRTLKQNGFMVVLDVVKDMQVVRLFIIDSIHKIGQSPKTLVYERLQLWYDAKGKVTIYGQYLGMGGQWMGAMEIRKPTGYSQYHYNFILNNVYPNVKLLPIYRRNGLKKRMHYDIFTNDVFISLLTESKMETLIKAKQTALLISFCHGLSGDIKRYWPSIKIAIRNSYKIKDANSWIDHLKMLEVMKKDLRNPKIICPADFQKAHRDLIIKKEKFDQKNLVSKMREEQQEYEKMKGRFFGLKFEEGNIEVKFLESIKEFKEEADKHKHCVFANKYYNREDSLIFSAMVNGEKKETIEISLNSMNVVQARGKFNQPSKYNNEIVQLVNRNIKEIKKRKHQAIS